MHSKWGEKAYHDLCSACRIVKHIGAMKMTAHPLGTWIPTPDACFTAHLCSDTTITKIKPWKIDQKSSTTNPDTAQSASMQLLLNLRSGLLYVVSRSFVGHVYLALVSHWALWKTYNFWLDIKSTYACHSQNRNVGTRDLLPVVLAIIET